MNGSKDLVENPRSISFLDILKLLKSGEGGGNFKNLETINSFFHVKIYKDCFRPDPYNIKPTELYYKVKNYLQW